MSKKTRIQKVFDKAQNYKGFGKSNINKKIAWYEIEYHSNDDLIELHWLKIIHPSRAEKERLRYNMSHLGYDVPGAGETDFLALMWAGIKNPPKDAVEAQLYRATKCYQSNTIKEAIAVVYTDSFREITNKYVKTLLFNYCQLIDVVPGNRVSLTNRR